MRRFTHPPLEGEGRRAAPGWGKSARPFHLRLGFLRVPSMAKVEQQEQPERDKAVGENPQKVVGRIVPCAKRLLDVAIGRPEHEQRPSKSGGEPEGAADPNAEKTQNAPGAVVNADFELERASRRPADAARGLIGEEHMRDEAERQADNADVENQRIEQQQANDACAHPGDSA